MAQAKTTKSTDSTPKKGPNILLVVGLGCLGLLVLLAIVGTIVSKMIFKNVGGIGTSLFSKALESKTGIKTDMKGLEEGKLSFTDPKTGSTVDIGSNKLPDNFPKDFPVYPGSKVTSAASSTEKGQGAGFWVTFSTGDAVDKVSAYYKSKLAANGWETTGTYQAGDSATESITKGSWKGTLAIVKEGSAKETNIVVMLNEDTSASE